MKQPILVTHENALDRDLYLLELDRLEDIPTNFCLSSKYFICLIAADNSQFKDQEIKHLAQMLIKSGCAYLCSWGNDSDRAHVLADFEAVELETTLQNAKLLMTTSHESEPLSEALWFALNATWPDDELADECRSMLVVVIGSRDWGFECREALSNVHEFNNRIVGGNND